MGPLLLSDHGGLRRSRQGPPTVLGTLGPVPLWERWGGGLRCFGNNGASAALAEGPCVLSEHGGLCSFGAGASWALGTRGLWRFGAGAFAALGTVGPLLVWRLGWFLNTVACGALVEGPLLLSDQGGLRCFGEGAPMLLGTRGPHLFGNTGVSAALGQGPQLLGGREGPPPFWEHQDRCCFWAGTSLASGTPGAPHLWGTGLLRVAPRCTTIFGALGVLLLYDKGPPFFRDTGAFATSGQEPPA